nr:hypothetical protein [Deltaproteobacteria bacterium]
MSLLSAILTQDQVVSPRKIDAAIQRQVISGGDFETNLLEVDALGEDTLSGYCAALLGLPPASREAVLSAEAFAVARLPRELAARHQVVPLSIVDGRLVVIAAENLDASARRALETAAGMPIEVRAVTSFRLAWALWRYYQQPLSPRFLRLADRLSALAAGPSPVVTLPSARPSVPASAPSAAPPSKAVNSAFAALAALLDDEDEDEEDDEDEHEDEAPDEPPPHVTATRAAIVLQTPNPTPVVDTPTVVTPVATRSDPLAQIPPGTRPSTPPPMFVEDQHQRSTVPVSVPRPSPPPATRPLPESGDSVQSAARRKGSVLPSLDHLTEAQRRLAAAKDREEVIDALLTHVLEGWRYAALCVVQGDSLEGLSGRGEGVDGAALRGVAVPLKSLPAVAGVKTSGEAAIVKLLGTPEAELALRLGRETAIEAAVVPLTLRGRVTLLLWADLGGDSITPLQLRALGLFAEDCASAFARLIVERKRSSVPVTAVVPREPTLPPMSRPPRTPGPDREARAAALRSAVLAGVARRRPSLSGVARGEAKPKTKSSQRGDTEVDRLVEEVARGGTLPERTAATLLGMGDRALAALFRYFPGPNTLNRTAPLTKMPAIEESGPLLRLALMFRQAAVPALLEALDSEDPDRRFCALLCLHEVAHPSALPRLTTLVLGDDETLHPAAMEVLRAHRRFPEFASVGATLRTALREPRDSALVRRRAAAALGELRDVDAVPLLIAALSDRDGPLALAAQRGLVLITRQDFGTTTQHWIDWWSGASSRHRVEWLIDALLHVDGTLRHEASEELKKLTGQFFGYYYNLPRRERERAHQRYIEWWDREGAERFAGRSVSEGR